MSLLDQFEKILVLCAHTDDEFGCAGSIIKFAETKASIKYVALSRCEESVPAGLSKDILEKECRIASGVLGLKKDDVEINSFKVRHFPRDRQEILEKLVKLNNEYHPDLIFLPCSKDMHQDHKITYEEGFRAFKYSTLLGYELPQNINTFSHTAFIKLSEDQINKKIQAMSSYKSQEFRNYSRSDFIKGLANVRGAQCNTKFAEAYEVIRLIIN